MSNFVTRQSDEDAGKKLLNLFANPFQGQLREDAFWASFGVSLGFSVALALLFSFLRPRHNLVYAPRTKYASSQSAPPLMGKGPFAWIKPVIKTKENVLVDTLGVDAVVFLRFTRMLRNIFCVLGVLGVGIMLPVNISTAAKGIPKSNVFAAMTPVYTFGQGIWAQVILTWVVDLVVLYFMWYNYRKVHDLRRAYFNSQEYQGSLHARSILVRHIPSKMRSEEGILRLVDEVNPTGSLPIPIAMRNVKDVPELVEKHEEMVRKLESILAKYLKNPDRLPSRKPLMKPPKRYAGPMTNGKVDAIDYYRRQIEVLEQNINGIRQQIDQRDVMPFGFASWDHVAQAHIVANAARRKAPHGTKIRPAPRPSDIIWKNMPLTKGQLRRKAIMNALWVALLTFVWTPINACLAVFVSTLSNLGYVWEEFNAELQRHRAFWSLVQGVAAPAITSGIYLLLPIIFRRLQVRAGDVTKTARERHVLRNLFNFFILNNLIIFSLFSAVWKYVASVVSDNQSSDTWQALRKADIFEVVTLQLCQSISPFWVTWILQRNLGAAIDLAQIWTLFYQWFAKTFLAPTPRQYIEWTAPQRFDYASYYNYFLFYMAVSVSFATLQPVILLCTAVYFSMDAVLKKYLLMYVFVTKTESGGAIWKTLINRMIFSCILANFLIAFVVKARGYSYTMLWALLPLPFIMLGFKWYCARTFDPEMDFYQRDARHADEHNGIEPSSKSVNRAAARYRHPSLDKRLITPMVPAKAKHIVQQIYAGRLDSESGHDSSDIPMEPVKTFGRPQSNMPFEAVPEGQQDYQFYKNRSDFGEVGGDRLSKMMGDAISRPGTPGSLASGTQTPYMDSSRPGSPALGIVRKEMGASHVHPLKSQTSRYSQLTRIESNDGGDISLHPAHGPYTDPNDDRVNLLRDVDDTRYQGDQFMTMDQWRTPGEAYTPGTGPGGYDYFRSTGMK